MRGSRVVSTLWAAGLGMGAQVGLADEAPPPVVKVVVDDVIHSVSASYVLRALAEAHEIHAGMFLIELDTPGGLLTSTQEIIEAMLASETPVVVYVTPSGAHAASAGFLITIAADVAAMAPGTRTGASTPVSGTGQEMEETLAKKVRSDAAAYTRTIAERRGRNPEVAELAVTEAKAWTAREALEAGLIDLIAPSEGELLSSLDGRVIRRVDGQEFTLRTAGASVVTKEMTAKERVLSFIANPNLAFLLGLIGLVALYMEFTNPGAIAPGVVGALALLLAAFAFDILPVNAVGVLLLLVGFGLLVAEALTPSFGVLGAGGIVGIVLGAVFLFEEQPLPTPALQVSLKVILPITVFLGALVVFIGRKVIQAQRHRPTTGSEGLVGSVGTTRTAIERQGKVFIHGEYWQARAKEPIAEGETVKVVGVEGLVLDVERVHTGS